MTNREFLNQARPGQVLLIGGVDFIHQSLRLGAKEYRQGFPAPYSAGAIIGGPRGQIYQCSLRKNFREGIQRQWSVTLAVEILPLEPYRDETLYPNLALLDFGLAAAQTKKLLTFAQAAFYRRERLAAARFWEVELRLELFPHAFHELVGEKAWKGVEFLTAGLAFAGVNLQLDTKGKPFANFGDLAAAEIEGRSTLISDPPPLVRDSRDRYSFRDEDLAADYQHRWKWYEVAQGKPLEQRYPTTPY
jgi:hypothetical protein